MRRVQTPPIAVAAVGLAALTIAGLFLSALVRHDIRDLVPYNTSEFLISYQGGFVRRGLMGELIYHLPFVTDLAHVEWLIKEFSALAYATAFALVGARIFGYTRSAIITLLVLLQPFLFAFPVLTYEWIRKDCFLLAVFCVSLRLLEGRPRGGMGRWTGINALAIVAILSHELYGLSLVPVLLIVATALASADASEPVARGALRSFGYSIPSWLALALVVSRHGSEVTAAEIIRSWNARGIFLYDAGAIRWLAFSTQDAAAFGGLGKLGSGSLWFPVIFWPLLALLSATALCVGSMFRAGATPSTTSAGACVNDRDFGDSATCLIVTGICFAPMFYVGSDFGRWMFLWMAASATVVFSDLRPAVANLCRRIAPVALHATIVACRRALYLPASLVLCNGWVGPLTMLAAVMLLVPMPSYLAEAHETLVWQRALIVRFANVLFGRGS